MHTSLFLHIETMRSNKVKFGTSVAGLGALLWLPLPEDTHPPLHGYSQRMLASTLLGFPSPTGLLFPVCHGFLQFPVQSDSIGILICIYEGFPNLLLAFCGLWPISSHCSVQQTMAPDLSQQLLL